MQLEDHPCLSLTHSDHSKQRRSHIVDRESPLDSRQVWPVSFHDTYPWLRTD